MQDNNSNNYFVHYCYIGDLENAIRIYLKGNIHYEDLRISFQNACANGHLNVVKWLYSLNNIEFTKKIGTYIENKEFTKIITNLSMKKEKHDLKDIGCPICYNKTPDQNILWAYILHFLHLYCQKQY